ncbi:hypothetical protein FHS78_000242 [Parvibaculum indicum]|uniref:hypothetical protein n=1 Tax=Parvibaculum indicum TaxID=562969 RepID=UPI00141E3DDA|nr:hypothetical protein [Parvibaculum indicum]NIJ39987.1 hypothetical protein [Parvibaculum indicum]
MSPEDQRSSLRRTVSLSSLVMLSVVGVVAYFIYSGKVDMGDPVRMDASVEQTVDYEQDRGPALSAEVTIVNDSDETLTVQSETQCKIFQWFLLDMDGALIEAQLPDSNCADVPATNFIEPHHKMTDKFTLELDRRRVQPGDYVLFMRYWGYEGRQQVTIE